LGVGVQPKTSSECGREKVKDENDGNAREQQMRNFNTYTHTYMRIHLCGVLSWQSTVDYIYECVW